MFCIIFYIMYIRGLYNFYMAKLLQVHRTSILHELYRPDLEHKNYLNVSLKLLKRA